MPAIPPIRPPMWPPIEIPETVNVRQVAEELRVILGPMARAGAEPTGSMGSDTPIAVLSEMPVGGETHHAR